MKPRQKLGSCNLTQNPLGKSLIVLNPPQNFSIKILIRKKRKLSIIKIADQKIYLYMVNRLQKVQRGK